MVICKLKNMKKNSFVLCWLLLMAAGLLGSAVRSGAQTTLFTEDFESASVGQTPPAGWGIDNVARGNYTYFKSAGTNPICSPASGTKMVEFQSYLAITGTENRLKMTAPVSTIGYTNIMVNFKWFSESFYTDLPDYVNVQYSTDGITWNTAGAVTGGGTAAEWTTQTVPLPAAVNGQATLYVAFDFHSNHWLNCHLDLVHIVANGPLPPATVTVGSGTVGCAYPYTTLWMGGRTQLLYYASDMLAAGATPGMINSIGFNVTSASLQTMQNFNIRMMNTSLTAFTGWVSGLQSCYSGSYAVPGTGWQMITLQTPFYWDGSNVILEICYGNNGSYTSNTVVSGTTATAGQVQPYCQDNTIGCSYSGAPVTGNIWLPNLRFVENPYSGSLAGKVNNCFYTSPLPGVVVTCGSQATTTNSTGNYIFNSLPIGNYTVNYSLGTYTPNSIPVTITNGAPTQSNTCLNPIPGHLSGVVTSALTGNPIIGALVSMNGLVTYTTGPSGSYSLDVYPYGTFAANVAKAGFEDSGSGLLVFTPGNTIVQNFTMFETLNPPDNPQAVLNAGQTAVNITWGLPKGNYELLYDDGVEEALSQWPVGGNYNAVKFTPAAYPCMLKGGSFNIGIQSDYVSGSNPMVALQFLVFDASGPGGTPGYQIGGPLNVTPYNFGWTNFSFSTPVTVSSGSFYIVQVQGGNAPNAAGIALDNTANQFRSYMKTMPSGSWTQATGNFMIRALVNGPGGPLPLMSVKPGTGLPGETIDNPENSGILTGGYQVWRFLQGQEGTPANWVSIGTPATLSQADDAWPSLPCNPYRWAVTAQYTAGWSQASFTNGIGKCWTASVTVNVNLSCGGESTSGTYLRLQNSMYPDTVYTVIMGPSGNYTFPAVFKGTYTLTVNKFGYNPSVQSPVSIMSNIINNVQLQQNMIPPTNLAIDSHTLLATWNPPDFAHYLLDEDWSSGVFFMNGWTLSGGNNWSISQLSGNGAPSAIFQSIPAVTGYDQYLTSANMAGVHSPVLKIKYDIFLANISAPGTNFMKVEIWDGTTWVVLKSYSSNASIPWSSDSIDISGYTHNTFKIRFHASGASSSTISNWKLDNIKIIANDPTLASCMGGYNVYLNGALQSFTTANSYQIPAGYALYGQTVNTCVSASYGVGNSTQVCTPVIMKYLCYPTNLSVMDAGSTANLTWTKPVCSASSANCFVYEDGSMESGWLMYPNNLLWYGNKMNVGSTQSGQLTSVKMRWWNNPSASALPFQVDVFNLSGVLLGSSPTFVVPVPAPSGYMEVDFSTPVNYSGPFYCMVKWNNLPEISHYLGYDTDGPNANAGLDYVYNGTNFVPVTSYWGQGSPGVFCLLACGTTSMDGPMTVIGPEGIPAEGTARAATGLIPRIPAGSIPPPFISGSGSQGASDSPLSDPNLIGYNIYMAPDSAGPYSLVKYVEGADALSTDIPGLSPGVHWFRVTGYFDLGPIGFPGSFDESMPTEPQAAWIGLIPYNRSVSDLMVNNGQTFCYDALNILTIAGAGKYFTVADGGSASMVAGSKISYLYGTKVLPGGYMHGSITTTNQFCSPGKSPAGNALAGEEQLAGGTVESSLFKAWPNPTSGDVTVELNKCCAAADAGIEVYGSIGEKIQSRSMAGADRMTISLKDQPAGIYFIRVRSGMKSSTAKIIRQ